MSRIETLPKKIVRRGRKRFELFFFPHLDGCNSLMTNCAYGCMCARGNTRWEEVDSEIKIVYLVFC